MDTQSLQNRPFVESKLAHSGKSAADHIFIQKIFIPVIHTTRYFKNMVEKVHWPMLTVSARSGSSGKTKPNVSQNTDFL